MRSGKKKLTKVLVVCILIGVLLALLHAGVSRARELSIRSCCQSDLHQFGLALNQTNQYPADLSQLDPADVCVAMFICPGSREPYPSTISETKDKSTYIYVAGLCPTSPANVPLVICPPMNHRGRGGNVLFADQACAWIEARAFDKLIDWTYAYAKSNGLKVVVSESLTKRSNGKYRSSE